MKIKYEYDDEERRIPTTKEEREAVRNIGNHLCRAGLHNGWTCTRVPGHSGDHIAGASAYSDNSNGYICAIWLDEDDLEVGLDLSDPEIITRTMVTCTGCGEYFTDERPCCCDSKRYYRLNTVCHEEGYCEECCPKHSEKVQQEQRKERVKQLLESLNVLSNSMLDLKSDIEFELRNWK